MLRRGKAFIWIVQGFWKEKFCCVDVGKAGPEKPDGKESKGRKVLLSFAPEIARNGVYNC